MKKGILILMLSSIVGLFGCNSSEQPQNSQNHPEDIKVEEMVLILQENPDIFLLDVRQPNEYNSGHIKGSVLIPVGELESRISELDKNIPMIVYCRSGARSKSAQGILKSNGFQKTSNLLGGINAWKAAKQEIIQGE